MKYMKVCAECRGILEFRYVALYVVQHHTHDTRIKTERTFFSRVRVFCAIVLYYIEWRCVLV